MVGPVRRPLQQARDLLPYGKFRLNKDILTGGNGSIDLRQRALAKLYDVKKVRSGQWVEGPSKAWGPYGSTVGTESTMGMCSTLGGYAIQ